MIRSAYLVIQFDEEDGAADVYTIVSEQPAWLSPEVLHGRKLSFTVCPTMKSDAANRLISHVVPYVEDIVSVSRTHKPINTLAALRCDKGRAALEQIRAAATMSWQVV